MKKTGFTLIELMIVIVIAGIFASIAIPALFGIRESRGNVSYGVGGMVETRCIDGYMFTISGTTYHTNTTQILNSEGKPIACSDNGLLQ